MLFTQFFNILPGVGLGLLTAAGTVQVWHVNVLNLTTASLQVLGSPARQAIVPSLVPMSHLMNAVTLTTLLMQSTHLTAPVLAGFLIDWAGLDVAYFVEAALLAPAICCSADGSKLRAAAGRAARDQSCSLRFAS